MAKQSLLLALHKANDAVLASFDGWLLPSTFGDPASNTDRFEAVWACSICQTGLSSRLAVRTA